MPKRLGTLGKLLYLYTALLPVYIYWAYFTFKDIKSFSLEDLLKVEVLLFFIFCLLTISAIVVFYAILLRKTKKPDKEIYIKTSEKKSKYFIQVISSFTPFLLFIAEFHDDPTSAKTGVIFGSVIFIIVWALFIFKGDKGILNNILFLPYHIYEVKTKEEKILTIITKDNHLSGHTKVNQLDKGVFRIWN